MAYLQGDLIPGSLPRRRRRALSGGAAFAVLLLASVLADSGPAFAQPVTGPGTGRGNQAGKLAQALRYRPDGQAFVIENGTERFNRPLYGGNTAFRVDGGDRPEFVMYLPGRGGNLRLAIRQAGSVWWISQAKSIKTRYLPGELTYEISDPRLGVGALKLAVIADFATEGLLLRADGRGLPAGSELLWAFGGASGERGRRDGDIGTEKAPISEWFAPRPEFAAKDRVSLEAGGFVLEGPTATLKGAVSNGSVSGVASADQWEDPASLFAGLDAKAARPIATGSLALKGGPAILSVQVVAHSDASRTDLAEYNAVRSGEGAQKAPIIKLLPAYRTQDLAARFAAASAEAARRRDQLAVDTPDPYLNAAVAALNIGADATWDDPQQAIMHGAIAWRTKLLGWRGLYLLDALGWHDRARANLRYWFSRQNTAPIPDTIAGPDEDANLSRAETALHSNGDMSNSHYDMNAVFIDGMLRHLAWTGDKAMAKEAWPVLKRHLAWEKRLFRRTFDDTGLPLYEAYAQIWASDDIYYGGGGVAYASAYNVYANRQAARLAVLAGEDPAPYIKEADDIAAGMRRHLWNPARGDFAEYKDVLGRKSIHPSAGLWSYYHTIDSEVPTPDEAWSMTGAMLRNLPKLPVEGAGVPSDGPYAVLSTTDWMPYTWSVNNVVLGENAHAALALWQAGRSEAAYRLTKSTVLASMYMGITPGNVGTLNYLDVYRREAQRDFADGAGVLSRTVVEGLFGLRPDALAGRLMIAPGLPSSWEKASIRQADAGLSYRRSGDIERWTLTQPSSLFSSLNWRLPARKEKLVSVTVNGKPATWRLDAAAIGRPYLILDTAGAKVVEVELKWAGAAIDADEGYGQLQPRRAGEFAWRAATGPVAPLDKQPELASQAPPQGAQEVVDLASVFNDRLVNIFAKGKYRSPRTTVSLGLPAQGIGAWAGYVNDSAEIDDQGLRAAAARDGGFLNLPDGGRFALPDSAGGVRVAFVSQWSNYPAETVIPVAGKAKYLRLLMAGTTNAMQSRIDNGEVVVTYADGGQERLALENPSSWWPIEKDFLIDDFQFRSPGERPLRVDLKTAKVRKPDGRSDRRIPGGAATVLGVPLDPSRTLKSITVRALAQDVVIGVAGATLVR